jgi:hypothetical protein
MSAGWNRCSVSCNRSSKPISEPENGPLSFSRAGIPPARVELFAGSVGHWTQEVSKYTRSRHRYRTNAADTTCNAFGKSSRTPGKSWFSTAPGTGAFWSNESRGLLTRENGREATTRSEFERMMVADRIRIAKCFLHITPAEQIHRFKDRLTTPIKRWKLSYEDFRNRSRWTAYEAAIEDMMERTSTKDAPWYLIPANDKPYGRVATFTILIEVLGKGLRLKPRPLDPKVAEMAKQLFDLT